YHLRTHITLFFKQHDPHRNLHSFPTRRSSDLAIIETLYKRQYIKKDKKKIIPTQVGIDLIGVIQNPTLTSVELTGQWEKKLRQRSEEHTSELQSRENLVCRLLLEKKKNKKEYL